MKYILKKYYIFVLQWILFGAGTYAANILGIYPLVARSHFAFNCAILETLAKAGHSVTIIAPFSQPKTSSDIRFVNSQTEKLQNENRSSEINMKDFNGYRVFNLFLQVMEQNCYNVLKLPFVQNLLQSDDQSYDVLFIEMLELNECYMPIARKFQIPVIGTVALRPWADIDWQIGNPHPLVTPFLVSNFAQKMSFFERIENIYQHLVIAVFTKQIQSILVDIYRLYTPNYDIEMNKEYPSLIFVNTHVSIFPRALIPNVVEVSGVHLKPLNPLPQDIRKFIDEASNGAILFSLGTWTLAKDISDDIKKIFIQTFALLPQRVILKLDGEMENLPSNILHLKWLPQFEILAHDNVKLFITHCGVNSLYEAIHTATPVLMIPTFGDQLSNAALAEELGIGINLEFSKLTRKDLFFESIEKVLQNSSYTARVKELSMAFKDRPMSPEESVVYWTEYVLKFNGTKHLRSPTVDMPFYQYLLLDVIGFVVIVFSLIIFVLFFIVRIVGTALNYMSKRYRKIKTN